MTLAPLRWGVDRVAREAHQLHCDLNLPVLRGRERRKLGQIAIARPVHVRATVALPDFE
jgi:hypothetical protein